MVVEVDGGIHANQYAYDTGRTAEMEQYGIMVVRFNNERIEVELPNVLDEIQILCKKRFQQMERGKSE